MAGDCSLVETLRVLTSLELFLHSYYYVKHPGIVSLFEKDQGRYFKNLKNLLGALLVSHAALDTGKTASDLIKEEALHNLSDYVWCSFICVLGLSSAISQNIITFYPDCGSPKLKYLFSQTILPRDASTTSNIPLLMCRNSLLRLGEEFKHNHFVPLLSSHSRKRKYLSECIQNLSKTQSKISFPKIVAGEIIDDQKSLEPPSSSYIIDTDALHNKIGSAPNLISVNDALEINNNLRGENKNKSNSKSDAFFHNNSSSCSGSILKPLSSPLTKVIAQNDIASYRSKVNIIKYDEILNLVQSVFIPDENFQFPLTNGRAFKLIWLKKYSWLCYSPSLDGGFCMPCVLFGNKFPNLLRNVKNLVIQAVGAKASATTLCNSHEKKVTG